jgi:hypothetical protein
MRYVSPSFLVVTLAVSLFPWIEIRCENRIPNPLGGGGWPIIQQNAFEIALGKTQNADFNRLGGNPNQVQQLNRQMQDGSNNTSPAPLMWAVLGGTLLGTIIGFAIPQRLSRLILMTIAVVSAGGGMIAQFVMGFPLFKEATPQRMEELMVALDPQNRNQFITTTGYTLFFYVACLGLAGGAIGVLVDLLNPEKAQSPRDEDEDDQFPRRRRVRRDYDDDEDDRPRRRSRDDNDDEDKWPQRRDDDRPRSSRRDEEDEPPPGRRGDDRFRG